MESKPYFFTSRKVMAGAIAIVTLLVGLISLTSLPIEQYPDIAPPTINVSTSYTGADANSCMKSVIMPLEESINGVEGMTYMTSEASSTGEISIMVYFEQGTNPDMATVNVQNRVSKAMGLLPSDVTKVGVQVYKRQNSTLQIGALRSTDGRFDNNFIANYIDIYVTPKILRINGVGNVNNLGNTYSLRIWMNPDVMSQYGLVPNDIFAALGSQNFVSPAGTLGEHSDNTYQYTMEYKGRLSTIDEFKDIVIRAKTDGSILHLSDVAEVELGAISYTFSSNVDNKPGVVFIISQVAGANATEVNNKIDQLYEDLAPTLPPGLEFCKMLNANDFLYAAMDNVVETLVIAIILVVLVVYLFLHSFRATVIPTISIIVSMIGTFAIVKMAGFSLNILTLFALVLAIGTVVDDAIVVVEAVIAKFDVGYKDPTKATNDAIHSVFSAVLSCTLVFMAVFIPVTFMPGTSGTFFTQFGVTLAAAVGLSGVNALTLCPALCAIMLRPEKEGDERKNINYYVKKAYNAAYGSLFKKYMKSVEKFMKRPILSWIGLIAAALLMLWLMKITPGELVPQEDQGVMLVNVTTPPGYTLDQTDKVLDRIEAIASKYEDVDHCGKVSGYGIISGTGSNNGLLIIRLKNWEERPGIKHSIKMLQYRLYKDCAHIKEAQVLPIQPPQIPGYGQGNAMELVMQDQLGEDPEAFVANVRKFIAKLEEQQEVGSVYMSYSDNYPKYSVDVDAVLCQQAGVTPEDVMSVMGSYFGGAYISNFNQYGKIYRVMAEASPEYRLDPQSLKNIFIRTSNGMAPLSQFVTIKPKVGPDSEKRFNLYSSIDLSITPSSGYSSGQVMETIKSVFSEVMPANYSYEYGGISREEAANAGSNMTVFVYIICVILIYLIMACLYNSWLVPFAVLFSIPFGLMGAYAVTAPLAGMGFTNNIYLQTGVIMLIGLLSKTAILITEFATEKRRQGMSIAESAYEACKDRLRPILMTVACMVIGMIPLVLHGGAGAVGNRSLALGVIGGMVVGTIALIFVVPVFYMFFQKMQEKVEPLTFPEETEKSEKTHKRKIEKK